MSIEQLTPTRRALAASFEGARATHTHLLLKETPAKAGNAHGSLTNGSQAAVTSGGFSDLRQLILEFFKLV